MRSSRYGRGFALLTRTIPLFALLATLMGCGYDRIVDDVAMLSILGFDKTESGFKGTALYSDYTRSSEPFVIQGTGETPRLILTEMNRHSPKPIQIGKLRLLLIHQDLAEKGSGALFESICMDLLISNNMLLAVSKEPVGELLANIKNEESGHLPKLIEQNIHDGEVPLSNLHVVLFDYYGEGRDIFIPYLTMNEHRKPEVTGLAVFRDQRMKLLLDEKEMKIFKMLQGSPTVGTLSVKLRHEPLRKTLTFVANVGRTSRLISTTEGETRLTFNVHLNAMVKDYHPWTDFENPVFLKEITSQTQEQLQERCQTLLDKFQEEQVDPLGIGDYIRARRRNWDEKAFYEQDYPKLRIRVKMNVRLVEPVIGV